MSFFKKYKIPLIILLVLYTFTIVVPLILLTDQAGTSFLAEAIRYIPNTLNLGQSVAFFITVNTLATVAGVLVSGYLLGPVYLYLHKYIIGRKKVYAIQEGPSTQDDKFKGFFRGFFPALLAIGIVLILIDYPAILGLLVDPAVTQTFTIELGLIAWMPVMMGLSIALFAPAWSLLDTGILVSNKEKVKETGELLEINSLGGWYLGFLKGYAGLTTIISLFFTAMVISTHYGNSFEIVLMAILVVVPLYTILSLLAIVLFDVTGEHRRKFLLRIAGRIGISEPFEN